MAVLVLTQCARNFAYCSGQGRRGVCAVTLLLILSVCLAVDVPIHFCAASGSIDVSSKMSDRVSCFCILCKTVDSNSKNWTFRVRMNLPIWSSRLRVRKVYFWKKDVNFKVWNFILTFFLFFFGFPVQQLGVLTGLKIDTDITALSDSIRTVRTYSDLYSRSTWRCSTPRPEEVLQVVITVRNPPVCSAPTCRCQWLYVLHHRSEEKKREIGWFVGEDRKERDASPESSASHIA